ncbi:MAG: type II toxin-antitoxin system HicA family toxin [Candidatus Aenigmarchaeota archaeon]|nr:type II toxin-antitoxin system HicA family toxin [Candidatus Aenigmarchaeota archaeon]
MKLPILKANELTQVLKKMGFDLVRQKGSHAFLRHPDGKTTVIPVHPTEEIDRGLLNKIIKKDLKINRDEFTRYL